MKMVNFCCVTGCKNECYPGSRFSFHRFPKNENQKLQWINAVPGKVTKSSVVCSAHFKSEDFFSNLTRKMLKSEAVPSIFPLLVPPEKRVIVLSDLESVDPEEGPTPKTMKLQESICTTQTTSATSNSTPRKQELHREVKVLKRVIVLSDLKSVHPGEGPAPKIMNFQESIGTQTASATSTSTPRKQELRREAKVLKRVIVLSDLKSVHPEEGPARKTMKLQESIGTQTASATSTSTPSKQELRRKVKVLRQRLKRRDDTINNLKSLLELIKEKCKQNCK